MTEQEYQKLLQDRVELLEQIKRVQAEVAKGGFIPPATRAFNRLLRERTELLQKQQQIERSIRGAPSGVVAANQFRSEVAANLEGLRQQRLQQQQQAAMAQAVRRADLQSRYGAGLGGSLAALEAMRNSGAGRMLGGAAIGAGAMIGGMARQGFSGTVEQNRFDYEFKLLSREVAAAFKPLLEVATTIVNRARRFMEGLGETGQNVVLAGGLALTGAAGLGMAGMVGRAGMGLLGMRGLGGAAPALAAASTGGGGGAMNMAALAATSAIPAASLGMTGTTAARGGIRGLLGRAARFPVKHPLMTAALAVGGASMIGGGPAGSEEFRSRHGENADRLDELQRSGGVDALKAEYDRLRAGRTSGQKFYSAVGSIFNTPGQERDTIEELERRLMAQGVTPSTGKRRSVTPGEFGFEEIGSGYGRALESSLSVNAMAQEEKAAAAASAGDGGKGTLGEIRDTLQGLFDWATSDLFGALKPKPPVS